MKKLALSLAAFLVLTSLSLAVPKHSGKAAKGSKTFTGEIFDSQCAMMGSHEAMMKKEGAKDAKECTLSCVKMGGKFVLYDAAKKATYQLDDQEKPKDFAGQKVKVTGTYDKVTKTIHVEAIEGAS